MDDKSTKKLHSIAPIISDPVTLGRYKIIDELGQGGMGKVYKVYDPQLKRDVALKTIFNNDDLTFIKRFRREAEAMGKLDHPNIIKVYDIGIAEGIHYFTMEYVEGKDLTNLIKQGRATIRQKATIVHKIALAIDYAHSRGIIHRDIKPSNILIDEEKQPRIMDFGLAQEIKGNNKLSKSGAAIGTPSYMPPEQAKGLRKKIDERSDIYSLGACLYELLTARPPFSGRNSHAVLLDVAFKDPISPHQISKKVPHELSAICLKALEKEKRRRYQTSQEFADDLQRFLNGEPVIATNPSIADKLFKWIRRHKAIAITCLTMVAIVSSLLLYLFIFAPGAINISSKAYIKGKWQDVDAKILIDGEMVGQGSIVKRSIYSGKHQITIEKKGYHSASFSLNLEPREEKFVERELYPIQGKLSISSPLNEIKAHFHHLTSGKEYHYIVPLYSSSLDIGKYEITFSKQNYFPQSRTITIGETPQEINIELEPMLLWDIEVSNNSNINDFKIADLDNNGRLEIICSSKNGSITTYDLKNQEKLWHLKKQFTIRDYHFDIQDVNNDGVLDIINGNYSNFSIIDGQTHEDIFEVPSWWGISYLTKDFDQDGHKEVVLFHWYRHLTCYSQKKKVLWKLPSTSKYVKYHPHFIDDYHFLHESNKQLKAVDIRTGRVKWSTRHGEGRLYDMELIHLNNSQHLLYFSSTRLVCLDLQTRKTLWTWPRPKDGQFVPKITIISFDKNNPRILLQLEKLHCIDGHSGKDLWQFDLGKRQIESYCEPVIGDLLADGNIEIVLGTSRGEIYIISTEGKEINKFQTRSQISAIALADVDEDNRLEIIFGSETKLYCIHHKPEQQLRFISKNKYFPITPAIADLDNDQHMQTLVIDQEGKTSCYRHNGETNWSYSMINNSVHSPIVEDLNGDKRLDVLVRMNHHLVALDHNGKQLWKVKAAGEHYHNLAPVVANIDKDIDKEIFLTSYDPAIIYCIKKGKIKWQQKWPKAKIASNPYIGNIDSDSNQEVLLPTCNQKFLCLDAITGKTKWHINLQSSYIKSVLVKDIDNDGNVEIFIGQEKGYITCLQNNGRIRWTKHFGNCSFRARFLLDNFDNDQRLELICSSMHNHIYSLDALTGQVKWHQFLGGSAESHFTNLNVFALELDNQPGKDIVVIDQRQTFVLLSGIDGKWLADIEKFGALQSIPSIVDIDKDNKLDMAFINQSQQLVYIYDIGNYFLQMIQPRRTAGKKAIRELLLRSRLNKLIYKQAYTKLGEELLSYSDKLNIYQIRF